MRAPRTLLALVAVTALVATASPLTASADAPAESRTAADRGAAWVADQVTEEGIFTDLGSTVRAALTLAAAGRGGDAYERALTYATDNIADYVDPSGDAGPDNPGRLGYALLLAATSPEVEASDVGGVDLVDRLAGTLQSDGAYGDPATEFQQSPFNQALAILGLVANDQAVPPEAVAWLESLQCDDGSTAGTEGAFPFGPLDGADCDEFDVGLDATGLALQALVAAGATSADAAVSAAVDYLGSAQLDAGGWGLGAELDPNSTALVMGGLVAAGEDLSSGEWEAAGGDPYGALLSFQVGCERPPAERGAFTSPFADPVGSANALATFDAVPSAAGTTYPFGEASFDDASPLPPLDCDDDGDDGDACDGDDPADNDGPLLTAAEMCSGAELTGRDFAAIGAFFADWDGDGADEPVVGSGRTFALYESFDATAPERTVAYGRPGDSVLIGDWDGDGDDEPAVRRGRVYYLAGSFESGPARRLVAFGTPDDVVHVGDWDGDGDDEPLARRGAVYLLRSSFSSGVADRTLAFGKPTDTVLYGDWDGDGSDEPAAVRDDGYLLADAFETGPAARTVSIDSDGRPLGGIGDWDGDGDDEPVFLPAVL